MTPSSIPPVLLPAQAGASLSTVSSLQDTNASLVLGFLETAQETASAQEAAGYLERLEPALDAAGASGMASRVGRLMRAQEKTADQMAWLSAAHDCFASIVNAKIPHHRTQGKTELTLVELLAESPEAIDLLMGNSEGTSELHEDYVRRARQLKRLIEENNLSKVQSMSDKYKNAVLFILAMEPHIPEMLALDDTLNYLSAGVWEISAAVYGQIEATNLIYARLRIANSLLGNLGGEPRFEEKIGEAFERADHLQERIQEIDLEAPLSVPPAAAEREPDRLSVPPEEDPNDDPSDSKDSEDSEILPSEYRRLARERDGSRVTLGDLFASKPGAPLARIQQKIQQQLQEESRSEETDIAALTVQSLIDSFDVLLESLRDG